MNEILDKSTLIHFLNRAEQVNENTTAVWGKMNAAQMFQHLNKSLVDIMTNKKVKRMFAGRIIGKMILKKALSSSKPIDKNSPTAPNFIANKNVDFNKEKGQWIDYLNQLKTITESDLDNKVHPFFGKMIGRQWNGLIYKHIDHHLRQFDV